MFTNVTYSIKITVVFVVTRCGNGSIFVSCAVTYGTFFVLCAFIAAGGLGIYDPLIFVVARCGNGGVFVSCAVAYGTFFMLHAFLAAGGIGIHYPLILVVTRCGNGSFFDNGLTKGTVGCKYAVVTAGCFPIYVFNGIVENFDLNGCGLSAVIDYDVGFTCCVGGHIRRILFRNALHSVTGLCRRGTKHKLHGNGFGIIDGQFQTVQVKGFAFKIGSLFGKGGNLDVFDGLTAETSRDSQIFRLFYNVVAVTADKRFVDKPAHEGVIPVGSCDQVDLFAVVITTVRSRLRNRTVTFD